MIFVRCGIHKTALEFGAENFSVINEVNIVLIIYGISNEEFRLVFNEFPSYIHMTNLKIKIGIEIRN